VQGSGQIFPVVERALEGLKPGDKKSVTLKPEEAFGPRIPDARQVVPRSTFPNADSMKVGDTVGGTANGRRITAVIQKVDADSVTLDMNHPLAGKDVTFDVEIVSVQ
jgi:peptidylprolyl isomerase